MTGVPPGVPRRAGGHAADRLREQLEREFGIADDRPEPAAGTEPDGALPPDAGPDLSAWPDPDGQQEH